MWQKSAHHCKKKFLIYFLIVNKAKIKDGNRGLRQGKCAEEAVRELEGAEVGGTGGMRAIGTGSLTEHE